MRLVVYLPASLAFFLALALFSGVNVEGASLPVITLQPTNVTLLGGAGTTLRVSAEGDPTPEYQWYFEQAALAGQTFGFLGVFNASTLKQGSYFAVVSNTVGMVTSDVAVVTVVTSAPAILSQPSNITATVGQSTTISVTATGLPPSSYTWWFNETNRLNSSLPQLTLASARETNSGTYTVVLSNSVASITSAPIAVTVSPVPMLTLQPTNQTLIETDVLTMHVAAIGPPPLSYQWFFETAPIAGATATNFTIASVSLTNSGNYYCVVSNYGGTATSEVATITVSPAPTHPGALDVFYKPNTNGWDVTDLILLKDDGLLAAGSFFGSGLLRLRVDGTIDTSFTSNTLSSVEDIALQPDSKIIAANATSLVRLDTNGVRDLTFSAASIDLPNPILSVGLQPDGGIVFSGQDSWSPYIPFGRLSTNGMPDPFFLGTVPLTADGGVQNPNTVAVKFVTVLSDGKIITPYGSFRRHHSNGTPDSSFQPPLGLDVRAIESVIPTPDQRAFIAIGSFTNFADVPRRHIARIDDGGRVDLTFVPSTNLLVLRNIAAAAVQKDGKVIVSGQLVSSTSNLVMRLHADGSLDETFTPALLGTTPGNVNVMAIQPDGKILIGGTFIRVNGRRIHGLARLHGDPPSSPEILTHPQDATATIGQKVSLRATVRAFGNADYQWYRGDALVATGIEPHLHLPGVASSDAGDYRLVVATSYGSVTSQVARLTVEPNPETPGAVALDFEANIDGPVYAMEGTTDGKYIVAGNFNHVDGVSRPGLARLHADGSLDTTFDPPEAAPRDFLRYIRALAPTASGALYIGGAFTNVGGVKRQLIARLHSDGSLDESFDPGHALHGGDEQVNAIAVLSNTKVLAAGSFTYTSNWFFGGTIARFHPNGALDTNFVPTIRGTARCLSVINSNAVLVGGSLQPRFGSGFALAFRLLENGADDRQAPGGFNSEITIGSARSMKLLSDGKILLGGGFPIPGTNRTCVVRLFPNGAVDRTFMPAAQIDSCSWVAETGCGKVLIGGSFRSVDGQPHRNLARLNNDGTLDTTFDSQPFDGAVMIGLVLPDGDAMVAGDFLTAKNVARPHVARINNGPNELPGIATQPITQSIAEGTSTILQAELLCRLPPPTLQWRFNGSDLLGETNLALNIANARLSRDGAYHLVISNAVGVTTSLVAQLTVIRAPRVPGAPEIESTSIFTSNSLVRCLHPLPDGKLLVGGSFSNLFGATHRGLVRLTADGSYDPTFNYATNGLVRAIAVLGNGRIMVNEWALSPASDNSRLLRLHADGALDTTFQAFPHFLSWTEPANGLRAIVLAGQRIHTTMYGYITGFPTTAVYFAGSIHTFAVQPDGKLLVGGDFTRIGNVARTNLARLEKTDGAVDRAFAPLAGTINAMAIQPDGRIVVGGQFSSAGGLIRRGVARFHSDGTLDEGFSPQPGVGGTFASVRALALQPDGKVIIGGSFNSYDGVPCNNIARLNADGTLDQTFQPGTGIGGTNAFLNVITLAEDGGILVGGRFSTFSGLPRHSLARAYNNPKAFNLSRDEPFTRFSFLSLLDRTYILESKSAASDDPWLPVHSIIGDGTIKTVTHSNATGDALLYRLRVE